MSRLRRVALGASAVLRKPASLVLGGAPDGSLANAVASQVSSASSSNPSRLGREVCEAGGVESEARFCSDVEWVSGVLGERQAVGLLLHPTLRSAVGATGCPATQSRASRRANQLQRDVGGAWFHQGALSSTGGSVSVVVELAVFVGVSAACCVAGSGPVLA